MPLHNGAINTFAVTEFDVTIDMLTFNRALLGTETGFRMFLRAYMDEAGNTDIAKDAAISSIKVMRGAFLSTNYIMADIPGDKDFVLGIQSLLCAAYRGFEKLCGEDNAADYMYTVIQEEGERMKTLIDLWYNSGITDGAKIEREPWTEQERTQTRSRE